MQGATAAGIPLLIGSCATSGRDWGVDWFAEHGPRHRQGARPQAQGGQDLHASCRPTSSSSSCGPASSTRSIRRPHYDEDVIRSSVRIVGVMGAEQFQAALDSGADVVLGGRATDTGIFAAIPLARGFDPGPGLARRQDRRVRNVGGRAPPAPRRAAHRDGARLVRGAAAAPTTSAARRSASRPCNCTR